MQRQRRRAAAFGPDEADLRVDHAIEKRGLALGISFKFGLRRRLDEQASAIGAEQMPDYQGMPARKAEEQVVFPVSFIGRDGNPTR